MTGALVEPCVRLWCAALEARDGEPSTPAVADRARDKFLSPIVRFAIIGPKASPFAFALTTVPSAAALPPVQVAGRVAYLSLLASHPGSSGAGYGRQLFRDAAEHARERGYESLVLHVNVYNSRAMGLYRSEGMVQVGEPSLHPISGAPFVELSLQL
jgi:ribosomal protein S18 acetylase RimI-like enzyme